MLYDLSPAPLPEVSYGYIRSHPTRSQLSRQDWRVDSIARVGDLSYKALDRISSVLSGLDTAVREGDHILAKHCSFCVPRFTFLESWFCLDILHPILVSIGLRGEIFFNIGGALGNTSTGGDKRDEENELVEYKK